MTTKIYSINEIKEILKEVLITTDVKKAILFGSYAKNKANEKSDIDLLIDSNGILKRLKFFEIIDKIQEKIDKNLDIIEKSEIEKNSKIEKEIKESGIVVYEKWR